MDQEILIGFFGCGDVDKKAEGESGFQMVKDNSLPEDAVVTYAAYVITDDGEVMATRNNPDRVTLPPNFKGYVVYDINDYKNNWVSSEEDNNIDLSKTSIKTIGLNINANDVDVDSCLLYTSIDWRDKDTEKIQNRVMKNLKPGAFVLMHPTANTLEALKSMISQIKEQGYTFKTVSEMLEI